MTIRTLTVLLSALALAACAGTTKSAVSSTGDPTVDAELLRLRTATRPYQSLDSAVAAGYPRTVPDCLVHAHHGAMGYHHVNRAYLSPTLSIDKPQILLYERLPDGGYQLNGVEFIIPYRMYPRDSAAPVWMGQTMHHEDNLDIWYLHVWAWKNNPDGMFANFNSTVSCPGTGKVYEPFARDGAR
jgi:hypothetical protein